MIAILQVIPIACGRIGCLLFDEAIAVRETILTMFGKSNENRRSDLAR